ncbi:uncharacterized protein DUF4281 [Novosphingobium kunmingense]|uniref:Uncharacterized protein DUF4281 n=1 Tax=Novosphingobium kunmingense TaxID=1211806 RepID=A0A2N0I1I0_9SPHN|nr:ABA4-like family protein [Novosphingobium kunmingense]PKB25039.1 uncharacterized protein DUF4281 [Novosphingobium kunmingense]
MWPALFSLTNLVAVMGWATLLALPYSTRARSVVMYGATGLLCLAYAAMLVGLLGGVEGSPAAMPSYDIAGIRSLFAADGGIVLGWTHYLAFDLFVGIWIASDAANKAFPRLVLAPVLVLTFLVGPVGLLVWLAIRERRARALARASGTR